MAITKIGTPELFDFSATNTALQLPTGDTASRPSAPSTGEWRYNTTLKYVEYYDGAAWFRIDTEAPANPDDFPSQNFNVNTYYGTGATQTVDAKFNEAANFNGSSASITLPNSVGNFSNTSISTWFYLNNTSGTQTIIEFDYYNRILFRATSTDANFAYIGNSGYFNHGITFAANQWYNLVITFSNGNPFKIYVNNVLEYTGGNTSIFVKSVDNILGSGNATGGDSLNGKLDQVRVFNTAITDAQVTALYAETTTTAATLDFPAGAGCIAAYQLDGDIVDVGGTYGGVESNIGYTGLKFQPDLVWIKRRNAVLWNNLFDSIRGVSERLFSNETNAESFNSQSLNAFDSNGFSVGTDADVNVGEVVAWNWYAPTAETNNAGSNGATITSTIKKNVDAGFSIVQWAGTDANATVAHGLNSKPQLILFKARGAVNNWGVYAEPITASKFLVLNDSAGEGTSATPFQNTEPTSTIITLGSSGSFNRSGTGGMIAYCFTSIPNYQKIGSYTGTGASGNIISTELTVGDGGFEPAFLLVKRTDNTADWFLFDNKRVYGSEAPANPLDGELRPNRDLAEDDYPGYNFYTNGFEVANNGTNMNANGGNYIYLAIAADKDTSVPTLANSFETVLYTGNGGTQNISTSFAPDLTWIKARSVGYSSALYDTVRGATYRLVSNTTDASTSPTTNGLTAFNSNGFTLGGSNTSSNGSGTTYVAWNWKAGGLPTINTDGSLTSIVSANQAAGFSVVKYKGSTGNTSFGTGLTSEAEFIIFKRYTSSQNWFVFVKISNVWHYLEGLNTTSSAVNYSASMSATSTTVNLPSASEFNQDTNSSYLAYCFHSITGYQKIGTYTGNGSEQTTTTGFVVSFLMIKRTSGSGSWIMVDSVRDTSNPRTKFLTANTSDAEVDASSIDIDFLSDGFSTNGSNADINDGDYIYLAIA